MRLFKVILLAGTMGACASSGATSGGASGAAPTGTNKMMHCPSAVEGAKTTLSEVDGGVEVTVIAPAEPAVAEIRKRAKHIQDVARVDAATPTHNGQGAGGGGLGRCPTVMKDVEATTVDVDGGAKIVVKAKTPAAVDEVRQLAKTRLAAMGG